MIILLFMVCYLLRPPPPKLHLEDPLREPPMLEKPRLPLARALLPLKLPAPPPKALRLPLLGLRPTGGSRCQAAETE